MLRLYLVLFLILTLMRNHCNCQALKHCHKNACFTFVNWMKLNWSKARSWCLEKGADLAIIRNGDEQSFIKEKLPDKNRQEFWIGLSDTNNEHVFQWVDGTSLKFDHWLGEQPKGEKRENCIELYIDNLSNPDARWNDKECSKDQYFICRKTKTKTSKAPPSRSKQSTTTEKTSKAPSSQSKQSTTTGKTTPSSQSSQSTITGKTSTPSSQSTQSTTTDTTTTATAATAATVHPKLVVISCMSLFIIALS